MCLSEKLTKTVEDRFAFVDFDPAQQLDTMPDKRISADIDRLVRQVDVELWWLSTEMHLLKYRLALVDMRRRDYEIGVPFGVANAAQRPGQVVLPDGVVNRSRCLAGSRGPVCWIVPARAGGGKA